MELWHATILGLWTRLEVTPAIEGFGFGFDERTIKFSFAAVTRTTVIIITAELGNGTWIFLPQL